jgi:hypothetical protein
MEFPGRERSVRSGRETGIGVDGGELLRTVQTDIVSGKCRALHSFL